MDRVFKSKIDWWYHLMIGILAVLCVLSMLNQNGLAIGLCLVAAAVALHLFFNTYYVVTGDGKLILRSGFFPRKEIAVSDISALQPSILPVFSYALSLDRIIIWKGDTMWMLVSPRDKKEFVSLLRKINPNIQIKTNSPI